MPSSENSKWTKLKAGLMKSWSKASEHIDDAALASEEANENLAITDLKEKLEYAEDKWMQIFAEEMLGDVSHIEGDDESVINGRESLDQLQSSLTQALVFLSDIEDRKAIASAVLALDAILKPAHGEMNPDDKKKFYKTLCFLPDQVKEISSLKRVSSYLEGAPQILQDLKCFGYEERAKTVLNKCKYNSFLDLVSGKEFAALGADEQKLNAAQAAKDYSVNDAIKVVPLVFNTTNKFIDKFAILSDEQLTSVEAFGNKVGSYNIRMGTAGGIGGYASQITKQAFNSMRSSALSVLSKLRR